MRYELPRKNIDKDKCLTASTIPLLWDLKFEWQFNIYIILKNQNPIPIKSLKNMRNYEELEEDLFHFLLLALYYEIPYQMGTLYIMQNGISMRDKFERDKGIIVSKLYEVLELTKEWETAVNDGLIDNSEAQYNIAYLNDIIRKFAPDIKYNHEFKQFEYLEFSPQEQNPLFNKKINTPTALRDLTIRYLDLLLTGMKIEFKSTYQKHKYIYDMISLVFNKNSKAFDLMNNLEIADVKKYTHYDLHAMKLKYDNVIFEIYDMIEPIADLKTWETNRLSDKYYQKAGWISLPIIFPYSDKSFNRQNIWKRFDIFYKQCSQYAQDYYTKEEEEEIR